MATVDSEEMNVFARLARDTTGWLGPLTIVRKGSNVYEFRHDDHREAPACVAIDPPEHTFLDECEKFGAEVEIKRLGKSGIDVRRYSGLAAKFEMTHEQAEKVFPWYADMEGGKDE